MMAEQGYPPHASIPVVIESLLYAALPGTLYVVIPQLVREARQRPAIACQIDKRWGDLDEAEANLVAREVGIMAHTAISCVLKDYLRPLRGWSECPSSADTDSGRAAVAAVVRPPQGEPINLFDLFRDLYAREIDWAVQMQWGGAGLVVSVGQTPYGGTAASETFAIDELDLAAEWLNATARGLYPQAFG